MRDLLFALGAILAVEGLILALAPSLVRRALEAMSAEPEDRLRLLGLVSAGIGTVTLLLVA